MKRIMYLGRRIALLLAIAATGVFAPGAAWADTAPSVTAAGETLAKGKAVAAAGGLAALCCLSVVAIVVVIIVMLVRRRK